MYMISDVAVLPDSVVVNFFNLATSWCLWGCIGNPQALPTLYSKYLFGDILFVNAS